MSNINFFYDGVYDPAEQKLFQHMGSKGKGHRKQRKQIAWSRNLARIEIRINSILAGFAISTYSCGTCYVIMFLNNQL